MATEEAAEGRGPAEKGIAPAAAPGSAPTCAGMSAAHVGADAGDAGDAGESGEAHVIFCRLMLSPFLEQTPPMVGPWPEVLRWDAKRSQTTTDLRRESACRTEEL